MTTTPLGVTGDEVGPLAPTSSPDTPVMVGPTKRKKVHVDTAHWTTSRLLSTAARLNEHHQNRSMVDLNVTQAGATVLKALLASGPISQSRLAGLVHVQAQTMGKVLAKLELRGLVIRARNSADQRAIRTHITQRGRTLLESIDQLSESSTESGGVSDQILRQHLISIISRSRATPA